MTPYIYVYSLPSVPELEGCLKIGYTEKDPIKRIKEQLSPIPIQFDLLHSEKAIKFGGVFFKDYDIHRRLEKKGFQRIAKEWFKCSVDDVKTAIREEKELFPEKLKNTWGKHIFGRKYLDLNMSIEKGKGGQEKYINFLCDFEIVGGIINYEKAYLRTEVFCDFLQEGVFSDAYNDSQAIRKLYVRDRYDSEIFHTEYYYCIFQHDMLWLTQSGQIFCTSTPYEVQEKILAGWERLVKDFSFPSTIKMRFLNEEHNFYSKKWPMIMIYDERRIKC